MFNKTLFGIGLIGTDTKKFEIAILTIVSFFELVIDLILLFPFRGLIVELLLDCNIFGLPVKFWFRKRRKKPPDKLCNPRSPRLILSSSSSRFQFWTGWLSSYVSSQVPSFKSNTHYLLLFFLSLMQDVLSVWGQLNIRPLETISTQKKGAIAPSDHPVP